MRQGGSVHRSRKGEAQKSAIHPADQARTDQLGRSGCASGGAVSFPGNQGIAKDALLEAGKAAMLKITAAQLA